MFKVLSTMTSKVLGAIISSLVLFTIILTVPELHEQYLYSFKGQSVVKILGERSGGTGFAIKLNNKPYILTNKHICNIQGRLYAHFNNKTVELFRIKKSKLYDLCLMSGIEDIPTLSIASTIIPRQKVWLIGYPALRPLTIESGRFVANMRINIWGTCNKKQLAYLYVKPTNILGRILKSIGYCLKRYNESHINVISYGGNSGSPLLNSFGNVVGVLFAGSRQQVTSSFMVSLAHVKEFLNKELNEKN